jgi:hypothetical protein
LHEEGVIFLILMSFMLLNFNKKIFNFNIDIY